MSLGIIHGSKVFTQQVEIRTKEFHEQPNVMNYRPQVFQCGR